MEREASKRDLLGFLGGSVDKNPPAEAGDTSTHGMDIHMKCTEVESLPYFWAFYSLPLICVSVFVPAPSYIPYKGLVSRTYKDS